MLPTRHSALTTEDLLERRDDAGPRLFRLDIARLDLTTVSMPPLPAAIPTPSPASDLPQHVRERPHGHVFDATRDDRPPAGRRPRRPIRLGPPQIAVAVEREAVLGDPPTCTCMDAHRSPSAG